MSTLGSHTLTQHHHTPANCLADVVVHIGGDARTQVQHPAGAIVAVIRTHVQSAHRLRIHQRSQRGGRLGETIQRGVVLGHLSRVTGDTGDLLVVIVVVVMVMVVVMEWVHGWLLEKHYSELIEGHN